MTPACEDLTVPQREPLRNLLPAREPASSSQEAPDEGFLLLQGPAAWTEPLTRRAKLSRLAVILGVALLAVGVVAGSSALPRLFPSASDKAASHAPSSLRSALPFPTYSATNLRASLPVSAYTTPISHISVAPGFSADAHISVAWICWVTVPLQSAGAAFALHAARTLDGGRTWLEVPTPITSAAACRIIADHDTPERALLVVETSVGEIGACAPRLLLTSDDGGAWNEIPPAPIYATDCAAQYAMLANRIFVSADATSLSGRPETVESWRIGQASSWLPATSGLPGLIVTSVAGVQSNGRLVGAAIFTDPQAGAGQLVESEDGGATWSVTGSLPGANATLFMDERAAALRTSAQPIYVIADIPPQTDHTYPTRALWRWNETPATWESLPGIPRLANAPDPLTQPDSAVIGMGPGGGLLVSAPVPGSANEEPASRYFWYWDDTAQRWLLNESQSASGAYLYGLGWSANDATLWFIYLHIGVPPHLELHTAGLAENTFAVK
jgi:hypothetical protein